jgi:PAS domain-containing protein
LHLDNRDLTALDRLAKAETQRTGSRVSASQIVRRLIRQFLHNQPSFDNRTLKAIIVRDQDGTIKYWSREAELIYGWTPQEVLGMRTHSLFKTRFPTSLANIEKETREKFSWKGQLIHSVVTARWSLSTVAGIFSRTRKPNRSQS